jgi:hypothetical protein
MKPAKKPQRGQSAQKQPSPESSLNEKRLTNSERQYLIKKQGGKRDVSRQRNNNGLKNSPTASFSYKSTNSAAGLQAMVAEFSPDNHISYKTNAL